MLYSTVSLAPDLHFERDTRPPITVVWSDWSVRLGTAM